MSLCKGEQQEGKNLCGGVLKGTHLYFCMIYVASSCKIQVLQLFWSFFVVF